MKTFSVKKAVAKSDVPERLLEPLKEWGVCALAKEYKKIYFDPHNENINLSLKQLFPDMNKPTEGGAVKNYSFDTDFPNCRQWKLVEGRSTDAIYKTFISVQTTSFATNENPNGMGDGLIYCSFRIIKSDTGIWVGNSILDKKQIEYFSEK